jgi:hypothetical protein
MWIQRRRHFCLALRQDRIPWLSVVDNEPGDRLKLFQHPHDDFCAVCIALYVRESIGIRDSSSVSGNATTSGAPVDMFKFYAAGSTAKIESLNWSVNCVFEYASGFYASYQFNLSLHFSTFSGNSRSNCLGFSMHEIDSIGPEGDSGSKGDSK